MSDFSEAQLERIGYFFQAVLDYAPPAPPPTPLQNDKEQVRHLERGEVEVRNGADVEREFDGQGRGDGEGGVAGATVRGGDEAVGKGKRKTKAGGGQQREKVDAGVHRVGRVGGVLEVVG